jgi:hypothetical protein
MTQHRVDLVSARLRRPALRSSTPSSAASARSRAGSCGRNSCSGGSSRRMSPAARPSPKMPRKSSAASAGSSRARPPAGLLVVGQIISRMAMMPLGRRRTCARCGTGRCPRRRTSRAVLASTAVSALVHPQAAVLVDPAHQLGPGPAVELRLGSSAGPASPAGRAVERDHVAAPNRLSPTVICPRARRRPDLGGTRSTQHLPMPRATTAAWLVMPPRAVRMPTGA